METTVPILKADGTQAGSLELQPGWIELEKGDQAVKDAVVAFLAGMRAGTGSAKTRAEVRGSGAKPYRQKGTGRARAGTRKSPIWRGGGIIFPPKPRSFAKKVNRKVRQLALKRAISERFAQGDVILVDELALAEPRTRAMAALLKALNAGEDVLVIADELTDNLLLASRNLPNVQILKPASANAYWVLLYKKIVITQTALEKLMKRLCGEEN